MDATMDMHMHHHEYTPPLVLAVLSGIFLALGAVCFLVVLGDILWRRGWRSMMGVMIPVHPINAAYMLPVSLWLYFKHGRPTAPNSVEFARGEHCDDTDAAGKTNDQDTGHDSHACHQADPPSSPRPVHETEAEHRTLSHTTSDSEAEKGGAATPSCHHHPTSRPTYVTVLAGVSHCGAGCVLGDVVGEWLVYGTGAAINGQMLWPALLTDYAFALLFGIAFQYFSIAPMTGQYGLKTVWRAAKADILSLTSFEVGAFGWMVIYQVGIFDYKLEMTTWTYWWMMQIGMALGFATAVPVNWWLISKGIKEPCC